MGLLVLTVKVGESICVGDDVTVTLELIQAGQVRLSFDAPRSVEIDRKSVRERKRVERREQARYGLGKAPALPSIAGPTGVTSLVSLPDYTVSTTLADPGHGHRGFATDSTTGQGAGGMGAAVPGPLEKVPNPPAVLPQLGSLSLGAPYHVDHRIVYCPTGEPSRLALVAPVAPVAQVATASAIAALTADLDAVCLALGDLMPAAAIPAWLDRPNMSLGARTPRQMIADGRAGEVWALLPPSPGRPRGEAGAASPTGKPGNPGCSGGPSGGSCGCRPPEI